MTDYPPTYCPDCGAELDGEDPRYRCPDCDRAVFHSPAVATAVTVVDADAEDPRVLLGERGAAPAKGRYSAPAGHVDFGEEPRAAAVRELAEETGFRVDPGALELLRTRSLDVVVPEPGRTGAKQVICIDYAVSLAAVEGEPSAADDLAGLRWVTESEFDGIEWAYTDDAAVSRDAIRAVRD